MCKICVNDFFYPTEKLPKFKVHKAFIQRPGLMYYQVRLYVHWRGENSKAVLKSIQKHLSLKTSII